MSRERDGVSETVSCPRCGNSIDVHVVRRGTYIESQPCWCPLTQDELRVIKQSAMDSAVLDYRFNPHYVTA